VYLIIVGVVVALEKSEEKMEREEKTISCYSIE
jgi:hypothetical protein